MDAIKALNNFKIEDIRAKLNLMRPNTAIKAADLSPGEREKLSPAAYYFDIVKNGAQWYIKLPYDQKEWSDLVSNDTDAKACINAGANDTTRDGKMMWAGDAGRSNNADEDAVYGWASRLVGRSKGSERAAAKDIWQSHNLYLQVMFGQGDFDKTPIRLHRLNPDDMRIRVDEAGVPNGFLSTRRNDPFANNFKYEEYEDFSKLDSTDEVDPEKKYVIHKRIPSNLSDYYGVPPVEVAPYLVLNKSIQNAQNFQFTKGFLKLFILALFGDSYADKSHDTVEAENFKETGAQPGDGTVITRDDSPTDELTKRITKAGEDNFAHLIMQFDGADEKMDVHEASQIVDTKLFEIIGDNVFEKIMMAFGLMPFRLGRMEQNVMNSTSGEYQLSVWADTVEMYQVIIEEVYAEVFDKTPMFKPYIGQLYYRLTRVDSTNWLNYLKILEIAFKNNFITSGEGREKLKPLLGDLKSYDGMEFDDKNFRAFDAEQMLARATGQGEQMKEEALKAFNAFTNTVYKRLQK